MVRVSFDIDGVLTDYPKHWLEYLSKSNNLPRQEFFKSKNQAKAILGKEYETFKHKYRLSAEKYSQPIRPEFPYLIGRLQNEGIKVLIASDRPFDRYENMKQSTEQWLVKNGIYDCEIHQKTAQFFKVNSPIIHVEDRVERIFDLQSVGVDCKFILVSNSNITNPPANTTILDPDQLVSEFFNLVKTYKS